MMRFGDKERKMYYSPSGTARPFTIPVKKTGGSRIQGKGATYDCIEYYTAEELYFQANSFENNLPVYITVLQTKNVSPTGFTTVVDKDKVADVISFSIGYHNWFPQTVTRGMMNYDGYMPVRSFTLSKNPNQLVYKRNSFTQEFLPTVTLNGVVHQNVYHLYLTAPQFTDDETYLNSFYQLEYVQGIYVKEDFGIVQIYTSKGLKLDISLP